MDNRCALLLAREAVRLVDRTETVSRLHEAVGEPQKSVILAGHGVQGVASAVFSPDGTRVLSGSDDGTARLWLVHSKDLLALADSWITRDFTAAERGKYKDLLGEPMGAGK